MPSTILNDSAFKTVRECLRRHDFDEQNVAARFGLEKLSDFDEDLERGQVESYDDSGLGVLVRLFLEGRHAGREIVREHLGSDTGAFERLGLIEGTEEISATAALYPCAGVYVASERWNTPDRTSFIVQPDVVYSALVANAQRFLSFLPSSPCRSFLELCAGAGAAAVSAARYFAETAVAVDIAERSCEYGEFNRRLNGLTNVEVKQGDLYDPVRGQTFDRITAHPPYVPVLRPRFIFHDGGEDGEQIVRAIVDGLPKHLNAGGTFYMLAMGSDRQQPFEQRLRSWLGDQADDFDVALFPLQTHSPSQYLGKTVTSGQIPVEDMSVFNELFERLEIKRFVYGFVHMQRRAEPRPVFTVRRQFGNRTGVEEVRWLLDWETMMQAEGAGRILEMRARGNPEVELHVAHELTDEGWSASQHTLITTYPFSMEANTDAWAPFLIGACDSSKTLRETFEQLKQDGVFPESATAEEFAQAVAVLISGGFLLLES